MQFLFDIFPVVLFFGAFKWAESDLTWALNLAQGVLGDGVTAQTAPVFLATVVAIIASIIQILILKIQGKQIKPMMLLSTAIVIVFGGLTIFLKNEMFIKWKPTILYFVFASILLYGQLKGKNYLKTVLAAAHMEIPEKAWDKLLWATVWFFVVVGVINLLVAYMCSTDTWVDFKLFGIMGLTLIYTVALTVFLAKNMPKEEKGIENREITNDK